MAQERLKVPGSGRRRGTPNKRTREVQAFFWSVLADVHAHPAYRANLVRALVGLELDSRIWLAMYHYAAGTPTKSVTHDAGPSLAALIAGTAVDPEADEDEGNE